LPVAPVAVLLTFVELAQADFDDGAGAGGGQSVQGVVGAQVEVGLQAGGAGVEFELHSVELFLGPQDFELASGG
jgi:hypothetical protein